MQSLLCISMEAIVMQTNNLLSHPLFFINKHVNIGSSERDLTQAKYKIDSLAPVSHRLAQPVFLAQSLPN